jgi:hypothetical protein
MVISLRAAGGSIDAPAEPGRRERDGSAVRAPVENGAP